MAESMLGMVLLVDLLRHRAHYGDFWNTIARLLLLKKTAIALLALLASGASLAATPWQKITHPVAG
ncbi:hypothetical protein ACVGXP_00700, partial [Enterobacter hormaechei]